MVATIINMITIFLGGFLGFVLKKRIKTEICQSILKAIGVVVFLFGILGVIKAMITIENNNIDFNYQLIVLISITLGTVIGELIKIDLRLNQFGKYIENKFKKSQFSEGFITASLVFCVGAMAITGSINAALGDPNIIYIKSLIDGITALILASSLGFGVMFAGLSVLLYQGSITILVILIGEFMTQEFINAFSAVGYVLVVCIGLNFFREQKIKIANMLPSLLIVIVLFILMYVFSI